MSPYAHPRRWLITLLACLTTLSVCPLSATVMGPLSLSQLTQRADYVVRVRVTQTVVRRVGGRHVSAHQLKLLKLYDKGPQAPAPVDLMVETLGGSYQGLQQRVAGSPSLQLNEEVIMFLSCPKAEARGAQHARARCTLTGMGQGLWRRTHSETGAERWAPSLDGLMFMQDGAEASSPLKPKALTELLTLISQARSAHTP